jgi:hippurate hydrolase
MITFKRYLNRNAYYLFLIIYLVSLPLKSNEDFYEIYKYLHQNPELSLQEFETTKYLEDLLEEYGYEIITNIGGNGFAALLKNGGNKTVLFRADMDALPIKEETGISFESVKTTKQSGIDVPIMHACGHDIHMTSLIGTAKYFSENKDSWKGTIVFILQPAEEIGFGARQMINAGLFKQIPYPDINLALHVSAQTQSGTVHITPGFAMANVDSVDVTFYGEGGHGAYPHLTKDPIVMSSQFITTVQTIISRNLSPINAGVVTVGSIHGGTKHNIIPNHVDLQITVRSYSDEDRKLIISRIKKIAESIAIQNDLPKNLYPIIKLRDEYTPAVFNNPDLAMRAKEILLIELGKDKVFDGPQVMGGEDFGQFGRVEPKIPSLLFWIGAVSQKDYKEFLNNSKKLPSLHSSKFLPDYEKTIDTGISSSIALIKAHLN